ncbi:unnamed protein product [Oppiella nova]|uniref:Uncharacterized protein n=1 Tax=Oppiella nova TaxID=334625 RepID=A0A7R9QSZ8_9ACAR|nr:unnamed protein product [Oppiella nova]CAG2173818.1 unnamed protein product [Oppiella nova]
MLWMCTNQYGLITGRTLFPSMGAFNSLEFTDNLHSVYIGDIWGYGFCLPFFVFGLLNVENITYLQLMKNPAILVNALLNTSAGIIIGFNTTTLTLHIIAKYGVCFGLGISAILVGTFAQASREKIHGVIGCASTTSILSSLFTIFESLGDFIGPFIGGSVMNAVGYNWATVPLCVFQAALK